MFRSQLVTWLNPLVWRSPKRAARKLLSFASAEQSSLVDMLQAARNTPSAARAALYLEHAADEKRHAAMFYRRALELSRSTGLTDPMEPENTSEALYERLGEIRFLAFVHWGEHRGRQQFESYARWFKKRGNRKDHALFLQIIEDERRHETYTLQLLTEVSGSPTEAQRVIRNVRIWEAARLWLRLGRGMTLPLYSLLMTVLCVLVTPLGWLMRLRTAKTRVKS